MSRKPFAPRRLLRAETPASQGRLIVFHPWADGEHFRPETSHWPRGNVKIGAAMLHIYNGDAAADVARNAGLSGEHLAWREALVCGPAPGNLSPNEFRETRARHLAEAYGVNFEECQRQLREQEAALERFSEHEEVVLWFEHDLFCQVHLIYLLAWFAQRELGQTRLSLVCVDSFPGIENFRGLGELNETQLTSLFPQRTAITNSQVQLGSRAWHAYAASTPADLSKLVNENTPTLSFLKSALEKHLQRFPSAANGLGRIENLLLELISDGHQEFKSLFGALQEREPVYGFGDAQVFLELKRLANAPTPMLAISNDGSSSSQISQAEFQITNAGEAVLACETDFIRLNGVDRWLGGVHLQSDQAVWRWDEEQKKLFNNAP